MRMRSLRSLKKSLLFLSIVAGWLLTFGWAFVVISVDHRQPTAELRQHSATLSDNNDATVESTATVAKRSVEEELRYRLERNDTTPLTVRGYVTSKRSLGKNLVFVDFAVPNDNHNNNDNYNDNAPASHDLCQALLRRDLYHGDDYAGHARALLPGTRFHVTGIAAPTRNPGQVVLQIQHLVVSGLPRQVQFLQIILEQYWDHGRLEYVGRQVLREGGSSMPPRDSNSKQWRKDMAKQIYQSLPPDPQYPSQVEQTKWSQPGHFVVPRAPPEWECVPSQLLANSLSSWLSLSLSSQSLPAQSIATTVSFSSNVLHVVGWVQNRRRFAANITMLSLVDHESTSLSNQRLVCILHPDLVPTAGLYRNAVAVGARVELVAVVAPSSSIEQGRVDVGAGNVWITDLKLVQSSSRSETIRHILDWIHEQDDDQSLSLVQEMAGALLLTPAEHSELSKADKTQRQWKANELAARLQQQQQQSSVDPTLAAQLKILDKYQSVVDQHPLQVTTMQDMEDLLNASVPQSPSTMADSLTLGTAGSKWQTKKRPQLAWMADRIRQVLQSHPEYGQRRLKIVDIGGGKGALAHHLGRSFLHQQIDMSIQVIDICPGAIRNGQQKANRFNLPVDFCWADAAAQAVEADVVVALHACGHLSDVALAHSLCQSSHTNATSTPTCGFVIVPCCFNSNPHLRLPLEGDPTVSSWLGIPADDWTTLKLLAEVQGNIPLASRAIHTICALRARAVHHHNNIAHANVSIQTFPLEFSTRNTVLVRPCA